MNSIKRGRFISFLLLGVLSLPLLCGTSLGQAARQSRKEKEEAVQKLEEDIAAQARKSDFSLFEKCLADDFVNVDPEGHVQSGSELMAILKDLKVSEYSIKDLKVRIYGNAAVATYLAEAKGKLKEGEISGKFVSTDVFYLRQGNWKMVSSHSSNVKGKEGGRGVR